MDVVTIAFIKDNKLLVVKPRSSKKSNIYTLIGGKVNSGENLIEAIKRETYEETKLKISEKDIKLILEFNEVSASDKNLMINMHMFLFNEIFDVSIEIGEEILDYKWNWIKNDYDFLSNSIYKHLLPYLREMN